MFRLFLNELNSDGVNELGDLPNALRTVLKTGYITPQHRLGPSLKGKSLENFLIDDVVKNTDRALCLIKINMNPDKPYFSNTARQYFPNTVKLYFPATRQKTNWKKTIYIVSLSDKYTSIYNPTTSNKLVERLKIFEKSSINIHGFKVNEKNLCELIELGNFESIDSFMEEYKSKRSGSVTFGKSKPGKVSVANRGTYTRSSRSSRSSGNTRIRIFSEESPTMSNTAKKTAKNHQTPKNPQPPPLPANPARRSTIV
jgi:hypothetical protein